MKKYSKKRVLVEKTDRIICNWCKKSGAPYGEQKRGERAFCGGEIHISFSYPSRHDDKDFELDICDECFEKNFKKLAKGV